MKSEKDLKELLLYIRDSAWSIPEEINKYELSYEMMWKIGSVDSELRDGLILELLFRMIVNNELTDKEVKGLLELSLSEGHLFYNIGKKEDDSIFNRTFTMLIIGGIIYRHNKGEEKIFTEEEIKRVHREILKYAREEKDLRGYVENKGWAHSVAHTADALKEIALCEELNNHELMEILEAAKEKICIHEYAYINLEDERLVSVVINIIQRRVLHNDEIINWIKDFKNINKTGLPERDQYLVGNQRNFLSALYFRLKRRNESKEFFDAIEEVLNETTSKAFK